MPQKYFYVSEGFSTKCNLTFLKKIAPIRAKWIIHLIEQNILPSLFPSSLTSRVFVIMRVLEISAAFKSLNFKCRIAWEWNFFPQSSFICSLDQKRMKSDYFEIYFWSLKIIHFNDKTNLQRWDWEEQTSISILVSLQSDWSCWEAISIAFWRFSFRIFP